jgi:pre-mRNA-splicing factor CWC22
MASEFTAEKRAKAIRLEREDQERERRYEENDEVRNGARERSRGAEVRDRERPSRMPAPSAALEKEAPSRKRKSVEMGRGGGVYIPPFRLKQMMAEAADDKNSEQYQKMMWEALRKTLNGIINKVQHSSLAFERVTERLKSCQFAVICTSSVPRQLW